MTALARDRRSADGALVALVPMRHDSERVRGKNFRTFGDRPLYEHVLTTLLACPSIDEVVVDTDSAVVRDGCRREFPTVRIIDRPEHLRAGTVPMNDVLRHDLEQVESQFYLQTHSTNPLLRPETIERAITMFFDTYPAHDSLFSVTRWQTRLYDADGRAINHDPTVLLRTQDLPPVYEENSNVYIFSRAAFFERGTRIGSRPQLFEINRLEAIDIDDEEAFCIAEALWRRRQSREQPQTMTGAAAL